MRCILWGSSCCRLSYRSITPITRLPALAYIVGTPDDTGKAKVCGVHHGRGEKPTVGTIDKIRLMDREGSDARRFPSH